MPDEDAHFGYAQTLAEHLRLPGGSDQPYSTEQSLAMDRSKTIAARFKPHVKVEWETSAYERWRVADEALRPGSRDDGGGSNAASPNPPLYYAYETLPYWAASAGHVFDRLYAMRIWSGLLLVVTALGTWFLAGEVFGRDRLLQLAAAATAGLQPMAAFMSASVNPDALTFAMWALTLWLGVHILKQGLTLWRGVAFSAAAAAALLSKLVSYALIPPVVFVLTVAVWRLTKRRARRAATAGAAAAVALALPLGAWLVAAEKLGRPVVYQVGASVTSAPLNLRGFGSYVWQFYLPRLPWQEPFLVNSFWESIPVYAVWVKTGWGTFGWLDTRFPLWVYELLAAFSVLVLLAAAVAVFRKVRRLHRATTVFLALTAVALLAGLHWSEYRLMMAGGGVLNQGRYLLPLLPIGGLAIAAAVTNLPDRWRGFAVALVLAGLFALQLFSLALVAARFYV